MSITSEANLPIPIEQALKIILILANLALIKEQFVLDALLTTQVVSHLKQAHKGVNLSCISFK